MDFFREQFYDLKPGQTATINWNDPITKGLVSCFLFNEGAGQLTTDLCGNGNGVGSGMSWGTPGKNFSLGDGYLVPFNNGGGGSINTSRLTAKNNVPALTVMTEVYALTDGASSGGNIFAKGDIFWVYDGAGTHNTYFGISYDSDATELNLQYTLPNNSAQNLCLTWDGSTTGTNAHLYKNNAEVTYNSRGNGGTVRDSDSAADLILLSQWNGYMYYFMMWNRVLSNTERGRMFENRHCFIQQDGLFPFLNSISVAPTTTKFRKTLSGIGTRTGSRQIIGA